MNINISKGALASILLTMVLGLITGVATVGYYGGRIISDVDNLKEDMNEQKDFNTLVLAKFDEVTNAITALTVEVVGLRTDVAGLQEDMDDLKEDVDDLKGRVNHIEGYVEGQRNTEANANPDVGLNSSDN